MTKLRSFETKQDKQNFILTANVLALTMKSRGYPLRLTKGLPPMVAECEGDGWASLELTMPDGTMVDFTLTDQNDFSLAAFVGDDQMPLAESEAAPFTYPAALDALELLLKETGQNPLTKHLMIERGMNNA